MSTVKNNAPPSLSPSGSVPPVLVVSVLVPPEVRVSCCIAGVDGFFVGGLDPSCSLGSSSGWVGYAFVGAGGSMDGRSDGRRVWTW